MSVLFRTCIGSLAAGLCCLPLANAQQPAATRPGAAQQTSPAQAQSQPEDPNSVIRSNRATAPRLDAPAIPALRPYTANYGGNQANEGQKAEVERYFANCLLKNNQAEIEISQFAAQQSQNPKVKQYAEELVKDHQKVVQELQPIASGSAAVRSAGSTSLDATANSDANRLATDTARAPGSSGTDTAARGTESRSGTSATGRDTAESPSATHNAANGNDALMQVAQIEEKINDRCNQSLREELQQKSGAEFDAAFLGSQIAGHMHLLAALEVIPQESQGQLKQIAEDAKPTVQKHLDKAKELMKERKSGSLQQTSATSESQR
jgi:predicted outer membrane protein